MLVAFLGSGLFGGWCKQDALYCIVMLHVYILYNYHLVSSSLRNTRRSKVLTAKVPSSNKHTQQARLRKPPGWLRERADACVRTGHPPTSRLGRRGAFFLLIFFPAHPSSITLPAAVFSRFRPQGVPHPPHPSLRPQTLVAFGYCSTVVPFSSLHRQFSTSHKKQVASEIYSIPSVVR